MATAPSSSDLDTSIGVVRSHAGAANAPPTPSKNDVASSAGGFARLADTTAAKAIEIAATAIWAPIKNLRGSITSASAPAGAVSRNIGRVVAT